MVSKNIIRDLCEKNAIPEPKNDVVDKINVIISNNKQNVNVFSKIKHELYDCGARVLFLKILKNHLQAYIIYDKIFTSFMNNRNVI